MIYTKDNIHEAPMQTSLLPPTITRLGGQRWAIFTNGGIDLMIDDTVTLKDVHSRWTRWQGTQKTPKMSEHTKTWNVAGSKGNSYQVSFSNETFSCSCPGYTFRRHCKHIQSIKDRYNED